MNEDSSREDKYTKKLKRINKHINDNLWNDNLIDSLYEFLFGDEWGIRFIQRMNTQRRKIK